MSKNFKKEGYSTTEVGQILGCSRCTVQNHISSGKMKALIKPAFGPNGKRQFRITRANLQEYLYNNKSRYTKELLEAWGVNENYTPPSEKTETIKKEESLGTPTPTGAWKDLVEEENKQLKSVDIPSWARPKWNTNLRPRRFGYAIPQTMERVRKASVVIDGRIAVAHVSEYTAQDIFNSLMNDEYASFKSIEIVFE